MFDNLFTSSRLFTLILSVITGLGCLYCISALIEQSREPASLFTALNATPVVHQLGKIGEQENRATYVLVNNSKQRIRIASIERTCSCTELSVSAKELEPGATANVVVNWNTHGMRGRSDANFNVYYSIAENPRLHVLSLGVEGEVIPDVSYIPDDISFALGSAPLNREITFVPKSGDPQLVVLNTICDSPAFTAEVAGPNSIRVYFEPKNLRGSQRQFTIQTVFDEARFVTIPVRINKL